MGAKGETDGMMDVSEFFPGWNQLTQGQRNRLYQAAERRTVQKGEIVHNGSMDCVGLLLVSSGQLRAFIFSDEGREITLYRLFQRDICLFSASCVMSSIQFDITIQAERECEVWVIPPKVYKELVEESVVLANYIAQIMGSRLSEVMWLIEQILWKSQDKRLAAFLLEESVLEEMPVLHITHEIIGNHLGTAREVITRMLRYFQNEGLVRLSRGTVELLDEKALKQLAEG